MAGAVDAANLKVVARRGVPDGREVVILGATAGLEHALARRDVRGSVQENGIDRRNGGVLRVDRTPHQPHAALGRGDS